MKTSEQSATGDGGYDAFISYGHTKDGKVAPAIREALQKFGKPWYSRASMEVFLDETGLAWTPDLLGTIEGALASSQSFILLASPEAAQSQWVEKEIQYWLQHKSDRPLLIVLERGRLKWGADGFDWNETNALPRCLQKAFKTEPLWIDLSSETKAELSLERRDFSLKIAKLVAGIRKIPLKQVFDEADAQQRKTMRWLKAAVAVLVVLSVVAIATALVSIKAKRTADSLAADKKAGEAVVEKRKRLEEEAKRAEKEQQRLNAISARLAGKATVAMSSGNRELGILLALEAVKIAPTDEAERALRQSLLDLVPPLVLQGHAGAVNSAQFSPDGKRVLTSGADGTVRSWDASTGTNLWTITPQCGKHDPLLAAFSADGTMVFTKGIRGSDFGGGWENSGAFELHEAATGTLLGVVTNRAAIDAALSPDGRWIATADFGYFGRVWDARTGKLRFELRGHEGDVCSVEFSSNGNWIVTGSWDGTARVWETGSGRSLAVLHAEKRLITAAFSPDGKMILTLGDDTDNVGKHLKLWDWRNTPGGPVATCSGYDGEITDFVFRSDGKRLATGSTDAKVSNQTVRIWDTASGKCLQVLSGHEDFIHGVDFSPNGKWVVTASGDRTAQIWDAGTGESLFQLGWNESPRTCVAFSRDGKRIITGTIDGQVPIYSYNVCGSVEDLVMLARTRVHRELTQQERQEHLRESQGE